MDKLIRYITPLSIVALLALLLSITMFLTPSEEGWNQMSAIILLPVAFVSLIFNAIVNQITSKRLRIVMQSILTCLIILLSYFLFR